MRPEIAFADGTEGTSRVLPYSAHFLLNDKCNARCVFCGGNYYNSTSGKVLSLEKFRIIANNIHLEHFQQVVLAGAGDPLLSPDFLPIIEYLRSTYPSVGIVITTNGIGLSRQLSENLVSSGVSSINISLNAATRATYQRLMQVDAFDTIISQIRSFSELCWQRGKGPQLQFSIPIMRCNIDELPLLVTLAHQLGATSINVFYCRFYPREIRNDKNGGYLPDDESLFFHQDLSDRVVVEAKQLAERLGVRLIHEPLFREGPVTKCCHWPDGELMIGFDGEIFPCGGGELHFKKRLERGEYYFGNALQQPIEEFWNNDSYRALRISSKQGEHCLTPECRECANMVSHLEQRAHILEWQDFSHTERTTSDPAPLVSVIVPTHNRPDMLAVTLQSILNQSFRDFEIIVINDAGQDVSAVIGRCNAPNIRYLSHERNQGLAAARNTALKAAKGSYIAYLDDDDIYYPNHLQTLVAFLENSDYNVAYTDACRISQRKEGDVYRTVSTEYPYSEDFDADRMLSENYIPVLCIMHRASCLQESGLFDETLNRHEDWDLWIRISRAHPFAHIKNVTCAYTNRLDGSGMVSGSVPAFLRTFDRICQKYPVDRDEQPAIARARQEHRYFMVYDTYHFLLRQLAAIPGLAPGNSPDLLLYDQLEKTGALPAEAASAYYLYCAMSYPESDDRAISWLQRAIDESADNIIARQKIAPLLITAGKHEEAVHHLEALFEINPYEKPLLSTLADYYWGRNNGKARFYLEHLVGYFPDQTEARQRLELLQRDCSPPAAHHRKKLTIAVFSLEFPQFACAQIRVISPCRALSPYVSLAWGAKSDGTICTTDLEAIQKADMFIIQRFYPRQGSLRFLEQMFATGKPIIYEVDDLVSALPDDNHMKPWVEETARLLPELLPRFTALTVSTPHLASFFSVYNQNVHVLPNLIDEDIWEPLPLREPGYPVVIGFTGTMTHKADLAIIEEALFQIADLYGSRVAFRFMGEASQQVASLPGFSFIPFDQDYRSYAASLAAADIDIALVPLVDNPFNRSKSNIKWLEYSMCGIAGIFSDLPPYNESVRHGTTGLLVGNSTRQWFDAIDLLLKRPDLRKRIATNAQHEVLMKYTLRAGVHEYLDTYQAVHAQHLATTKPSGHERRRSGDVKLSIIIPVFNQLALTRQCLEHLLPTLSANIPCEIIVIDNASTDETAAYLAHVKEQILVLQNAENRGFAAACNQGAAAARGTMLLFLNNDTIPQAGWIEPLVSALDTGAADICGARLLYPDGRCQHAGVAFNNQGLGYHIFANFPGNAPPVMEQRYMQAVTGACMLARAQLFQQLNGFDEAFRNGFEDVDFCLRAGVLGQRILYVPESAITHYGEQSSGRKDWDVPNMQLFFSRWQGRIRQDDSELYSRFNLTVSYEADGRIVVSPAHLPAPLVSIIIPLFNQARLTTSCLAAIEDHTSRQLYELILVDNGSQDETAELLTAYVDRATILINSENLGFAAACNQGARAARGEYLLFLNNDTEVTPGWLEELLKPLQEDHSLVAVGGKLLFPDQTIQHAGVIIVDDRKNHDPLRAMHQYASLPANHAPANSPRIMQALTAACLLVRRSAFEQAGGFDEGYWNGYEDVDLCFTLGQLGGKLLYQPTCVVIHHESKSGSERFRKAAANIRRLHEKWIGKIVPDFVLLPDSTLTPGPGQTGQVSPKPRTEIRSSKAPATMTRHYYPLIPLVPRSELSLLQKLTSSERVKNILKNYTNESN